MHGEIFFLKLSLKSRQSKCLSGTEGEGAGLKGEGGNDGGEGAVEERKD